MKTLKIIQKGQKILGGIFDVENKTLELKELTEKLSEPSIWDDPKTAQEVNKQKVYLERELNKFSVLAESISDSIELAEIAIEENDNLALEEIAKEISKNEIALHDLEFIRMFSNKMDPNNAYLDIQSGSGGTEAQDWAEMLMRMYLKWGEAKNFNTEVIEVSPVMGGEDFGMFGRVEPIIPTALFWLGAVNNEVYEKAKRDDLTLPSLHSDLFLPDADPAINTGVEAMSNAIVDLFANKI